MDTFMDKLSQKLNAQEIIRANTTAELGQVGEQIHELKECADRIQTAAQQMQEENSAYTERVGQMIREEFAKEREMLSDLQAPSREVAASEPAAPVKGQDDIIFIVEEEVSQLAADFAQFRESYGSEEKSGSGLEEQISGLREEIRQAKQEIKDELNVEMLDDPQEDFAEVLSGKLGEMQQSFDRYEQSVHAQQDDLAALIAAQSGELSTLNSGMAAQRDGMSGLMGEMSAQSEGLSALKSEMAAQKEEMSGLRDVIRRFQEQIAKVQEAQSGDETLLQEMRKELEILADRLTSVSESNAARNTETMEALKRFLVDRLDRMKPDQSMMDEQRAVLEEQKASIAEMQTALEETKAQMETKLTGVHEGLREGFHKECVKVYRNVQASMIEENEKQALKLEEITGKMKGNGSRAMIFSILAFAMALISVVLQVLNILHIL